MKVQVVLVSWTIDPVVTLNLACLIYQQVKLCPRCNLTSDYDDELCGRKLTPNYCIGLIHKNYSHMLHSVVPTN